MCQCSIQGFAIQFFQLAGHPCLLLYFLVCRLPVQQVAAQHGGQCQRHDCRGKQRNNKGDPQRHQHTPFHPAQEEKGHEADHNNERRIQNRHTYFARCIEHDFQNGTLLIGRQQMIFPYPFIYILHINNRIIDQRTDSNRHSSQTHGINSQSHIMQCQYGN